ncbi:MAG: T9SS type A sorting domain-containing protein, partial [Bacteroidia bacterium]|nr:T9SS type A sorting domain-containing protein [Bacteroidia bacterium]
DSSWQSGFKQTVIWQINKNEGYTGASLNPALHYGINSSGINVRNLCPVKGGSQLYGPDMYFLSNRNFAASSDTLFLVHVTDTINAPGQILTVAPIISDVNYHMPVNALQPSVDSLAVNDARVMGAFIENGYIQLVFNCFDTVSGKDCIFYGIADSSSSGWQVTGNLYTHPQRDLSYPNISYAGNNSTDNKALMVLLYSSPSDFPGTGAVLFDGINQFSAISTVKAGQGYFNMLTGGERWGDYTGSQRKYNQQGIVWVSGAYGLTNHTSRTWVAELGPDITSGTQENISPENDISLFPNPASERINVAFTNNQNQFLTFEIYDPVGKSVKQLFKGTVIKGRNEFSFSGSTLSSGFYVLKITGREDNYTFSKKFIKN